ncbi:MAG: hypothetical protein DWQ10_11910 [Calditrichaeota bacterium]|nr:MAG: hypothetical protein DWQ10_11910 [Calditrichota bacterium]
MKRRVSLFIVLMLVVPVTSMFAGTNGYLLNCFCARSYARGATLLAIPDNGAILLANPAGLTQLSGRAVGVGLGILAPTVKFQNTINPVTEADKAYYPMPFLSFIDPMQGSKWAWGFGFNVVGGMGTDYKLNHNLFRDQQGQFIQQEYYSNFGYMRIGPGVAYQINDKLSVGAGFQVYYGMLDFKMPFSLDPVTSMNGVAAPNGMTFGQMFAADPAMGGFGYSEVTAYAELNDLAGFGYGANLGVYYEVNDKFSVGLAYTSPTTMNFTGEAKMDMNAQFNDAFLMAVQGVIMQNPTMSMEQAQAAVMQMFGQMGIDMTAGVATEYSDVEVDFDVPAKYAFGFGLKPSSKLTLGLDIEYIMWEDAFDNMPMAFKEGTNTNINTMINGDANDGTFNYNFPLAWENIWNFKMGADFKLNEKTNLRAGFIHGSNPVPSNTVFAIFPAIVENHVTLGFGHNFGNIMFDFAYIHALNKAQDAVTSNHLIANEYNGSTDELSENLFMTTLGYSF